MYEVEVKVRADHRLVRQRLAELGAERTERVSQTDVYYDAPHREFAETDEALRIRREGGPDDGDAEADDEPTETRLTYKGPLVERASKTREEHETPVDDSTALEGVLDGLGFEPAATVEKERERYGLDGYTVTLDSVVGLGEFVEVEREAEEDGIESAREGAYEVLRDLGLDPADQIRTSYLGLLLADDGDASQ
ncbi:class IV adenylate cyclase [Halorarum halophilum]|uniref:Class IV adenylate cyclase n=1 Tax=Halorarum halophilum TaxID=2743090 RepID=A0A7D5GWI7_9EURY|nr:class IV adenylate cyclase [Halobaculum halophilum]QLG26949.1 class IV adenylate cyclase [Halobaculum halophilum]